MKVWKRFSQKEITHSMAHYLQAVAALKREKGHARVGDIAGKLGVSKSGVTSMLRSLQGRGLVDHERYGCVELTTEGVRFARQTEANRRILTVFFSEILGVTPRAADEDACMIEHLVSPEAMNQLLRLTTLVQSDDPVATAFREAFREYRQTCSVGGEDCGICEDTCLRETWCEDADRTDSGRGEG
ncbi:MAG: metal-dependent transcriptional regulator [Gemmatimonadota bacterium]|jgi:DtxR family Mn-dependent transcriptional regulator|nr:hypothetical protein [Gemmatimonadota bacterium]MDP6461944.1 metal-dependent transcriptional regulator [Gemmatimonadota bacterium]MDP6528401.1 metal-dependent transcriptional regulator [Gemmatimonadota bacterium]MDP6802548.1 metal-dependent transcriptional regulator [Gemmatimonadota bacterium]MDP7031811.1 metal-dependent transcriptional regulator [Gemmatimonadota bacterium]